MGNGQVTGVELFNHRLVRLWEANEQGSGKSLRCELKVFNRLFCYESLQKKLFC